MLATFKNLLQPDEVFLLPCQILLFRLCARKGAYWQVSVNISVSVTPRLARIQNAASDTGKQIVLTLSGGDVSIWEFGRLRVSELYCIGHNKSLMGDIFWNPLKTLKSISSHLTKLLELHERS
eukprot:TRINITY_DN19820_c0_g1_i1.p1 TRINITY_DN19820_c0_g1~~TRINITY_DN19820_c0_g1_i1.p1  ORF type:complete len:123 (-),score=3.18 TRINITY_DN19820_c0_g1_i1:485-853(-)